MSEFGTEILIFAGTTEGRELAEHLAGAGVHCTVSVATEYGAQILGPGKGRNVLQGRLTREQMEFLIREEDYTCVVDATHPFATEVSEQIRQACEAGGVLYLRLARNTAKDAISEGAGIYEVSSMQEAAKILRGMPGNIFVTSGSKDLPLLVKEIGDPQRMFVRVLPSAQSLKICADCGIPASHVIAMQGPFTQELNAAMLRQTGARAVLTKESGKEGGFDAKIAAAKEIGIPAVVVRNPERESGNPEQGTAGSERLTFAETLELLAAVTGVKEVAMPAREYVMIAAGPGDARHLTEEAREAVEGADVIFGAPTVIARAKESGLLRADKLSQPFYKAGQVLPYMKEHPELRRAAVLLSGDTGLYSGAAQLRAALEKEAEPVRFLYLPGISSVAALAAALQVTWEDSVILSTHGRERDVIGHLRREGKVFLLVSGLSGVQSTAELLKEAVAGNVLPRELRIGYGFNLSQESEESGFITLDQLEGLHKKGLYILYLENPAADACPVTPGMDDTEFARSEVPMTKEEVRVLALSRLRLTRKAVLYDIGAGTGSVTVEAARLCPDAQIFAIEKKPEAAALLRANLSKYCLPNVSVVEAQAPDGLKELPAPTHVFIGGSGRAMPEILNAVLAENPAVRIVVTCVTLETLSQTMEALGELPVTEPQVRQIAVTRARKMGKYHMMKALNPIYLIDFEGKSE